MRLPFSKSDNSVIKLPKPFSSHCELNGWSDSPTNATPQPVKTVVAAVTHRGQHIHMHPTHPAHPTHQPHLPTSPSKRSEREPTHTNSNASNIATISTRFHRMKRDSVWLSSSACPPTASGSGTRTNDRHCAAMRKHSLCHRDCN